jgi:hypothetical protein
MTEELRTHSSANGSFCVLPPLSEAADEGVRNVVKLEYRTILSEDEDGNPQLGTVVSTDTLVLDTRGVDPSAFDADKLLKDCETLCQIAQRDPEKLQQLLAAMNPGDLEAPGDIETGAEICRDIGLTEENFAAAGGGLWWIFAVLAGAALATGCERQRRIGMQRDTRNRLPRRGGADAGQ